MGRSKSLKNRKWDVWIPSRDCRHYAGFFIFEHAWYTDPEGRMVFITSVKGKDNNVCGYIEGVTTTVVQFLFEDYLRTLKIYTPITMWQSTYTTRDKLHYKAVMDAEREARWAADLAAM